MNEQRAHEVVEHLQGAAIELIAAARALLDVAEEFVRDPAEVLEMASTLAAAAAEAQRRAQGPPAAAGREPKVERIRVS